MLKGTASPSRRGSAFSLLEVLLALAVLSVGLAAFLSILSQSGRSAVDARIRTDLQLLAEMRLAQIESGELDPDEAAGGGEQPFDRKDGFTWTLAIDDDWEPRGRVRHLTLTVKYDRADAPDGGVRFAISRLIARRDDDRQLADGDIPSLDSVAGLSTAGGSTDTADLESLLGGAGAGDLSGLKDKAGNLGKGGGR